MQITLTQAETLWLRQKVQEAQRPGQPRTTLIAGLDTKDAARSIEEKLAATTEVAPASR